MNKQFLEVRVLIWDFDGTFYKSNSDLFRAIREAEYKTIMEHTGWDREHVIQRFEDTYKKITPSATQTVAKLCGITTTQAAEEMESYFDRREYVYQDNKLIRVFQRLKNFQHYILANGVRRHIEDTLKILGVDKNIFAEIVTSEVSGENKPSEAGFRYIMKKTELPAAAHMMIGDREPVDIVPAKALGMHTCLVWGEEKSEIADITLPSVYQLVDYLQ